MRWMCRCSIVPAISQSEVLAKFFEEIGEKCGEILAKFFADFRPSISRETGRKEFHEKSSTFSTVHQIKFFHCCNSGGLGAQIFNRSGKKSDSEKGVFWKRGLFRAFIDVIDQGHRARLQMGTWKRSSLRPMLACVFCQTSVWATKGFSSKCKGHPIA